MPSSTSSSSPPARTVYPRLIAVASVVFGFFAIDRLLWLGIASVRDRSEIRLSRLYRSDAGCDVLVLGNSRGVGAVVAPRLAATTGRRVFNLSSNGMSTLISAALLEDHLDRHDPPAVLLLEVSSVLSGQGLLHDLKLYIDRSDRIAALAREYAPTTAYASTLSWSYRANGDMFLRSLHFLSRSDQARVNPGTVDPALVENFAPAVREHLTMTPGENLEALVRIAAICEERNITLIPFIAPYLPAYRDRITDWDAWMEAIARHLPERQPPRDHSRSLSDPACFADPIHLNGTGADRLEALLATDIERASDPAAPARRPDGP